MKYILFPLQALRYLAYFPIAVVGSLFCIVFAPVICLFCDKNGFLPWWLKWFEPVDTASGCLDTDWIATHPTWSPYKCAYTFIQRNPFYGAEATLLAVTLHIPPIPLAVQAQALLDTSDKVATRCIKANVPYPAEWHTVDIANRNIVNGTDTTSTTAIPLPTTYPAGT